MTNKTSLAGRTVLALSLCLGQVSCESDKARAAARQFAFAWEVNLNGGFTYISDPYVVQQLVDHLEPVRAVILAEGSETVRREAAQLDALVLYVARCLDANISANLARPAADAARGSIPPAFLDPALNALLGIHGSDEGDAEKAMLGLHAAVKRFAEAAGVGGQFQEDKEARAQKDAADADKAGGAAGSWMQIRAAKIQTALENQSGTEEDAVAAGAPTGFGEAKWLMCPEQVMNVRPKAVATDSGNLSEAMEFLGRPAKVEYDFKKGVLARVIVTFQGSTGRSDFDRTQSLLQEAHGKMSAPSQTSEDLRSAINKGRFFIIHVLRPGNTEQVYFTE